MKKIFTNLFLLSLMIIFSQVAVAQSFSGGTGTETDPYQISNAADLKTLSYDVEYNQNNYSGTFFQMTNDIDMSGVTDFRPIGNNIDGDVHAFAGVFDGNGHKVYNLNANWKEFGFVGLFGIIMNARVENLTLASSDIYGDLSVAGIVGVCMMDNVISNCHTTSDVTIGVRKFYIAGICGGTLISGSNGTVIKDCTNGARITGCVGYSAGILATNGQANTQVLRCGNYGEISDDQLHVAGVVAHTKNGISIIDCYNTGKISMLALEGADNARGAGILAAGDEVTAEEDIVIKNCYNAGSFNAENEKIHAIYQGDYTYYDNTFVTNCYYASDNISGTYDYSIAMSLEEMKTQAFADKLNDGRTDEAYWTFDKGMNNGFPVPTNLDGVPTSIENVTSTNIVYGSGMITVTGANANALLKVIDLSGRVIATATADAYGNATISMDNLPVGMYIVSVNGKSIKVNKAA